MHDLHVWSLTPGIPLLCAHVALSPEADPTDVLDEVTAYCRRLGIEHSTVQVRGGWEGGRARVAALACWLDGWGRVRRSVGCSRAPAPQPSPS